MIQTNSEMKKHNTLKVFRALRSRPALTRREIEEITGLSWGSVSAICNELLERQFIVAEKENTGAGRPREKLAVHPAKRLSLGIDINSVGLSFNVINLGGVSVYTAALPLASAKREDVLALLTERVSDILTRFPDILGINLSMQGKLNKTTGVSIRTNFFEDWDNVPLVELFESAFRLPTKLYHDPECLLTYHLYTDKRLQNAQNGIVVRVDEGIGMAQLVNGRLYETGDDTACELGHTISVPEGRPCACGKRGCLEAYASLRGMKEAYFKETGKSRDDFLDYILSDDPLATALRKQAATYLGIALCNLFTLSAPSFILLDGILFSKGGTFFEEVKAETERSYNGACNLLRASYRKDAPAIGATYLTIEKNLENILF